MAEGLPEEVLQIAVAALSSAIMSGDKDAFMVELRRAVGEWGGVPKLAKQTKLHPKTLYRTLSPKGNPELNTLLAILKEMGLCLVIQPIVKPPRKTRAKPKQRP